MIKTQGHLCFNDSDMMIGAAFNHAGLTYVHSSMTEHLIESGKLVSVLDDWCPPLPGFFFYFSERYPKPALRAFIEALKAQARAEQ